MQRKVLSIVVPCYNEEKTAPFLLKRYSDALSGRDDVEVIIVNDGSKDATQEVLEREKINYPFLQLVHIEKNVGYGNAVYMGLQKTSGMYIGWTHGDLQTPPEDTLRALSIFEKYQEDELLYVKGRRYGRSLFDIFFTVGMSIFESFLFFSVLNDINAQPNFFRREFLDKWQNPPKDFSLDLYVFLLAKRNGYRTVRFPVYFGKRFAGVSSWNTSWRNRYKFIKRTISFSFKLRTNLPN